MTERSVPAWVIWALGVTQMTGYGTLYYSFSVLAPAMARDFGWTVNWVYGALSVALLAGGFLAPVAGSLADRYGAGRLLALGSLAAAVTLIATSWAPNGAAYFAGLVAIELASAFVFYGMAFPALVQIGGRGAQRSITHITLIAGLGSTLFWPLTDFLHQSLGWREVYQVFAAANLLICLPLHVLIARLGTASRDAAAAAAQGSPLPQQPATGVRGAVFGLMIVGFLVEGFVLSAILVHMVPMLDALSLSATAIFVTTLFGPAQVRSRFTNMLFGRSLRQAHLAVIAAGLLSVGLVVLLLTLPWLAGAMAFAILFGFGSGLTSIVGGTLPLELFGQAGYGSRSGWINSVRLVSSAIAPFIFSLLQESLGVHAAIWIIAGFGCVGIAAFVAMAAMAGAGRTAPA